MIRHPADRFIHVIPDGCEAADRESMASAAERACWIPGQTSGPPGMTGMRSYGPDRE